jgi:hypothetical protein
MKVANKTGVGSMHELVSNDVTELISFRDLLVMIWSGRRLVLTIVVALLALSILFAVTPVGSYRSEGYFVFGGRIPPRLNVSVTEHRGNPDGINPGDFNRFMLLTSRPERFNEYKGYRDYEPRQAINNVQNVLARPGSLGRITVPSFVNDSEVPKPVADSRRGDVVGVRIHYDGGSAEESQQTVGVLGRYIMDSIIYAVSLEQLPVSSAEATAKADDLAGRLASGKQEIEKLQRRIKSLGQITKSNSGGATRVVGVGDTEIYDTSAGALLTATEMQLSRVKEELKKTDRAARQALLLAGYRREAVKALESTRSGVNLIRDMDQVRTAYFQDKGLNDEIVKEVDDAVRKENSNAIDLYLHQSRFVAGPSLPKRNPVHLALIVSASLILGLMLSVLVLLLRNGWRHKLVEREYESGANSLG